MKNVSEENYTPTTEAVEGVYASGVFTQTASNVFEMVDEDVARAEFRRWLNGELAKAWTEGFDKGFYRGQILHGDYDASEAGIENPYEVE